MAQKRAVIRQSIQVHKQKGTLGALRRALAAFTYARVDIREWFQHGGDPFTFRAVIEFIAGGASVKNCQDIYETIMRTKNLRSWLEAISAKLETDNATPNMAARFGYEETICVYPKAE
jgi:P2-related tail formation protein